MKFLGAIHLLIFAKTEENMKKAADITFEKLDGLGLELAPDKTRFVNFNDDNFDFKGYMFEHWRKRKKDEKPYYIAKPKDATLERFSSEN